MKNSTRKIAITAMFCALAYVAVALFRIPVVMFLSYEPKDVIIALSGFIVGPAAALIVSVVTSLVEMLSFSSTGIIGCFMNILSSAAFACVAAIIYKKKRTIYGAVLGLATGVVCMTVAMILWNYIITPMYMGLPRESVAQMLVPMFLPFNLLKGGLNAALTFLLYRPVISVLKRSRLLLEPEGTAQRKTNVPLVVISAVILVSCVLAILSFRGVI